MNLFAKRAAPKPPITLEALEHSVEMLRQSHGLFVGIVQAQDAKTATLQRDYLALQQQHLVLQRQHATLAHLTSTILQRIFILTTKGTTMANTQDDYNAALTRLEADIADNGTAVQQVASVVQSNVQELASQRSLIADLQKQQPGLDLAALSKTIDNLEHNTAGLTAILAPVGTTTSTAPIITGETKPPAESVPADVPPSTEPNGGQPGTPPNPDPTPPTALDPSSPKFTGTPDAPSTDPAVNLDAPLNTSANDTATSGTGTGSTDATTATTDTATNGVVAQTQAP